MSTEPPFIVRQFEGTPWVPLHEAARLHDAVQESGLTIAALRNDLALAIAHDRQPYPTADAYERACRARDKAKAEVARLRANHIGELDAAWAEAKDLLPDGWGLRIMACMHDGATSPWKVSAGENLASSADVPVYVEGDPAAALRALAAKLREVGR